MTRGNIQDVLVVKLRLFIISIQPVPGGVFEKGIQDPGVSVEAPESLLVMFLLQKTLVK